MQEIDPWRPRSVDCGSRPEPWRLAPSGSRVERQAPRDSANPLRELFDAAAQGYTLSVTCRACRRVQIFHAAAVWHHFQRRGWPQWLRDVPLRFRCRVCNGRSPMLGLGHDEPTDTSLPLPDRYAWKRELSRRR